MSEAIEFSGKAEADAFRSSHPDKLCPIDDDKRTKTVHVTDAASEKLADVGGSGGSETAPVELTSNEAVSAASTALNRATGRPEYHQEHVDELKEALPPVDDPGRVDVSDDAAETLRAAVDDYRRELHEAANNGRPSIYDAETHLDWATAAARDLHDGDLPELPDVEDAREAKREDRKQENCEHAKGYCVQGEPEACEFLREECGLEQGDIDDLLAEREPERPDPSELEPELTDKERGALKRSWNGYQGAVSKLDEAISTLEEAWENAQAAAKAIDGVRAGVGEEPIHFRELEERQAELLDLVRQATEDCHECHADHSHHRHAINGEQIEDLQDPALPEPENEPA